MEYKTSCYRWIILFSFCFVLLTQAILMTNFSAIADIVAQAYGVTQTLVNLGVVVFFISAVAFTFLTVPAI